MELYMKILVVAGYCLQVNSSANLCHISYIKGLVDCGHTVDLLTVSNKNQNIDLGINIPKVHKLYTYNASLYEQLGVKKSAKYKQITNIVRFDSVTVCNKSFRSKIKQNIRKLYGTYGTDIIWYLRAKHWKSKENYDCVISLAYPPISHKLVENLLKSKNLLAQRWIQIWEDPWYEDIFGLCHNDKVKKEEERLLSLSNNIYYVSPLTLLYQKKAFPDFSDKMRWQPLPSYYERKQSLVNYRTLYFGYFGDYSPHIRNLVPFYNTALKMNLNVNICGNSSSKFKTNGSVRVFPRMGLNELEKYENQTNILVFLCNLKGGQIPGKIYQYAATNKIVLFILDGTKEEKEVLYNYFSSFKRFIFCENDEKSIEQAVLELRNKKIEESYVTPLSNFMPVNIIKNILEGK